MSDGSIYDLEAYRRKTAPDPADDLQAVRNIFDALEADDLTPEDPHREYMIELIRRVGDVLESTTETPGRDSLAAMIGAVIGVHTQYSGIGGRVEIDRAPQWLEAIEAADPDVARFTRALEPGNA